MKFLKADGMIEEGSPLTDRQVEAIERLTDYLHEIVCGSSYHSVYSARPCVKAALYLVPKLDDSAVGSLARALFVPEPESSPTLEPEAVDLPEPVAGQPYPNS